MEKQCIYVPRSLGGHGSNPDDCKRCRLLQDTHDTQVARDKRLRINYQYPFVRVSSVTAKIVRSVVTCQAGLD